MRRRLFAPQAREEMMSGETRGRGEHVAPRNERRGEGLFFHGDRIRTGWKGREYGDIPHFLANASESSSYDFRRKAA